MTKYPTKYESFWINKVTEVVLRSQSITILKLHENVISPITPTKSNQNGGTIDQLHIITNYSTKYESYRTNDLRGVTKRHRMDKRMDKPKCSMPPYYCMQGFKMYI